MCLFTWACNVFCFLLVTLQVFFFFFCNILFIKWVKGPQEPSPTKLYKQNKSQTNGPRERPTTNAQTQTGRTLTKRTTGHQPIDESRWGRKPHTSTTCPIAQQSLVHASRNETAAFLRCQKDGTTEQHRQRSLTEGDPVQPNHSQPRLVEESNLTDQAFPRRIQSTSIDLKPSRFLQAKRTSLKI